MADPKPALFNAPWNQSMRPTFDQSAEQTLFNARLARSRRAADSALLTLYGDHPQFEQLLGGIWAAVGRGAVERRADLRRIDLERLVNPSWFQAPDRIGYVAYADLFGKTLNGVAEHVDYLAGLNVTYLHLMSVLRAREGANDGGYAVADYGDVEPSLGTRDDLVELADGLRQRGISLCLDLVLNHTAAEHSWAVAARAGSAKHREMYIVYPDRTMPDRFEEDLPEVFPTMAPGNFTWNDDVHGWVWTTFNTYQWDLNYANPDVFLAMLEIIIDLANIGVDVLRLDAIAFTWKRLGTDCQNQPEAHLIAQAYAALLDIVAPGVLLKAEAIVPPEQLVQYLGAHRTFEPECHIAYHNQLMVMLWSSLASQDARIAIEALSNLPPTPHEATFVNYLRCHDDIGWAVSERDAAAVGVDAAGHRRFLAAFYRGDFPGSYAGGAPFSSNPGRGDERTSGSAAALSGISAAKAGGDAQELDRAVGRLLLGYGVVLGFPGIPLIYMGDELALDNDLSYLDDAARADDSRWMHRPVMPWDVAERRQRPGTVEHRVYWAMHHMITVRRGLAAMSAGGEVHLHRYDDPAVLFWARSHHRHGRFVGIANVAERDAIVPSASLAWAGLVDPVEVLGSGAALLPDVIRLPPLSVSWFVDRSS